MDFLLDVASSVSQRPLTTDDVIGAYAELRPLIEQEGSRSADLSRKHAVLTSPDGLITVVGGKLTTYRRMAADAVDATGLTTKPAVPRTFRSSGPPGPPSTHHPGSSPSTAPRRRWCKRWTALSRCSARSPRPR